MFIRGEEGKGVGAGGEGRGIYLKESVHTIAVNKQTKPLNTTKITTATGVQLEFIKGRGLLLNYENV